MNTFDLASCFIAVADAGSIYQASFKLEQTTAAISKKVSKLEKHLGVLLMTRGRKGVALTEAGQRYYHEAKAALVQLEMAELSTKQLKVFPQGRLRVVCNQFYAENKILPVLGKFLKKYPNIEFHLEVAEVVPNFNLKKMDILFGVSLAGQENLIQKKIDQTRYVLCASSTYLKKFGEPKSPAELLQHKFLAHEARIENCHIFLGNQEIVLKPSFFINTTQMLAQAAIEGLGIIWTHQNMIEHYVKKKLLTTVLDTYTQPVINIYVYYPNQKYHDPKVKAFLDFFK